MSEAFGKQPEPMNGFRGRVAIVTGAGQGLGRAYAVYFAARGARVLVNNRRRTGESSSADQVVEIIRSAGGEALANHDTVEDPQSGVRMVEQALQAWGRVDILVSNAGVEQHCTFHKIAREDFHKIFAINFFGALYAAHAAYSRMREAGYGRIVLSTSSAGLHGLHGLSAYASSKAALIALTRTLAAEGKSRNVLCNAIAPYAATRMTARQDNPEFLATMRPELVSPMVGYLASAQTRLNGEVIVAGKGAFRRAAMVEGRGYGYASIAQLTEASIERDLERILDMADAREFPDALTSFNDFFLAHEGAT
ncbi:MAG: SDR family NAD(P)-dependent oxidoreductase [Steroidobacteraceae bacterium]|jgi:NAD(P)-dependent dehydrogenase (short-subunit alcohol dehydrogenase family)|nr:SDR family NAD(P)-dependent oxidoreductase [Steroidobacteraceae bacterium]